MTDSDSLEGDDSEPDWLQRAARASVAPTTPLAPGTRLLDGRLVLEAPLGSGGMGVVYTAHDAERGQRVALKTLPDSRPAAIYRIKQEFRSLAGVTHENLVRLHDLFEDGGRWCFTMERIDGEPLVASLGEAADGAELREAFAQLAAGIEAIHRAGKLHRDLKPTNVLRTADGRVVILDFGLASDPVAGGAGQTVLDGGLSGTPAYMAPEQAAGRECTPASDWYAFGVMLYEALTGALPFDGPSGELMAAKQTRDPAPPAGAEPALSALCMQLLSRDPAARPAADAIRAVIGHPSERHAAPTLPSEEAGVPFVGREAELAALRAAFARTDEGAPVRMLVGGVSGVGKSALVERFLDELGGYGDALILRGRCYEHESVPFKAFDALVDELSRALRRLPAAEATGLMPAQVHALASLFPAIGRLEVVSKVRRRGSLPEDPRALRRLAFAAFKELHVRLSLARPVVLYVDDLQWGDGDSARLLAELLSPPDPPPLLFVGTYRSDERDGSAFLRALAAADEADPVLDRRELALERLGERDARGLAAALGARTEDIDAIAREAAGHPLFLQALASQPVAAGARPTLESAIAARVDARPPAEQRLLAVLALAARPLSRRTALSAAGLGAEGQAALDALIGAHLARSVSAHDGARVACYHDRVREVVAAAADGPRARAIHRALLDAFEAHGEADDEARVAHLLAAGEAERAAILAERGAERAAGALAFELAVRLYGVALDHGTHDADSRRALLLARARAHEQALSPEAAAEDYAAAAELAEGAEKLALRVHASAQRLSAAPTPEREQALLDAIEALDVELVEPLPPDSSMETILARMADTISGWLRVDPAQLLPDVELASEDRFVLEALRASASASPSPFLGLPVLRAYGRRAGAARSLRHLLLAGCQFANAHPAKGEEPVRTLIERIEGWAERAPDDLCRGWVARLRATRAWQVEGRTEASRALNLQAAEYLERAGGASELRGIRSALLIDWQLSGKQLELRRALDWSREAAARGDRVAVVELAPRIGQYFLAVDDPASARRYLDAVLDAPDPADQAAFASVNLAHIVAFWSGFYEGDLEALGRQVERMTDAELQSPAFGMMLRAACARVDVLRVRAGELSPGALDRAEAVQRSVAEEVAHLLWARPFLALQRAELALVRGDRDGALSQLEPLVREPDPQVEVQAYVTARRRYGELKGGAEGAALVEAANQSWRDFGIKNPDRYTAMHMLGA